MTVSQVALMVQLLTDGGPPALVSTAIIDALTNSAAAAGSDSVLLSADLIQRAGKHAMLLFVYVCATFNPAPLLPFLSCCSFAPFALLSPSSSPQHVLTPSVILCTVCRMPAPSHCDAGCQI